MDREQSGGVSWEFTAEIPPEGDPAFRQAEREASLGSLAAIEGDGWRQWSAPVDLLGQWQSSGLDGLSNIGSLQVEFEQAEQQERQQQEVTLEQSPSQKPAVAELAGESDVAGSDAGGQVSGESLAAAQALLDESGADAVAEKGPRWISAEVGKGDSLSLLFSRLELSAGLLHEIVTSGPEAKKLSSVRPGQVLRVKLDDKGDFEQLVLERSALNSLQVAKVEDGYEASLVSQPVEIRRARVEGTITDSLYIDAKREGLTDKLIMELAGIFGWDVDFALDIKQGDSFAVIYEERFINGERYKDGHILAAEFVNRGKVFRAVRFEDDEGYASYYTPDGHSMRKAFLRAPVDFRRISSRFNPERFHPVLGKKRPHRGVDYAAATGTPIKAAGDGRVTFRGVKGGYGNTIILKHGEHYTTLYAHLSKFGSEIKSGSRVEQGDIIGYVGATGLATGPHLHYEFRVDGAHRDPLTVDLPKALPIEKRYRKQFLAQSAPLVAELGEIAATRLASKD
jgi:murein DD-endopeptidase MepM/ murein hydrolase activator NlpD